MASVRLKPGSARWFACFKLPTGKLDAQGRPSFRRVQRSTGTADKSRALQLAHSYERAAVLVAEKRFTERAARSFLAELTAISGVSVAEVEATDAFLRRWFAGRRRSLRGHTPERYQLAVDQFLAWLGERAAAPLADTATSRNLAAFRDAQTAAGKSPATVNKALGILAQAFDEALAQHLLDRHQPNPARGLNVRGAKRARQRRRPFTFEQFAALVRARPDDAGRRPHADGLWRAAPDEWRTLILLGGYTGGRQQELAQLTWPQIDLARRRLFLDRTKTADEHALPLHTVLEQHLRAAWLARGRPKTGPVLPFISRTPRRTISNTFRRGILPAIGIHQAYAGASEAKGAGRVLAAYSFHSLRHSLSTWLQAAGVDELMRMRLIGHEDEAVNRTYTHTELAQAAAALAKIPAVALP